MKQQDDTTRRGISRRDFLTAGGTFAAVGALGLGTPDLFAAADGKPAVLGGKAMKLTRRPSWPVLQGSEEESILKVLKSGQWCRMGSSNKMAIQFEEAYAKMCGSKHCVATNSGTSALITSLAALEVGPGDEVITSPYTFIATINSILAHYALPVPVDSDLESFQVDATKVEAAFTANTKVLLPVHIGGSPADLGTLLPIAKKKNVPLVEDACQAHLGKWNGKALGSLGTTGCFSFQVTKNLCCGDGGAILTNDTKLANILFGSHNNGRGNIASLDFRFSPLRASNLRMTEFQAAVLLAQMKNIEKNAEIRNTNGLYLNSLFSTIPGVKPAKIYSGGTSAWHLYMFRIVPEEFGLSREKVIQAMNAEGISCYNGYSAMDWVDYVKTVYRTKAARRVYSDKCLKDWGERINLSQNKTLCSQAVWFGQEMLLRPKSEMDVIADALRRIQKNAKVISK